MDISFESDIKENTFKNKEIYFTPGPLVYARPIASQEKITNTFPLKEFHDYQYLSIDQTAYKYSVGSTIALYKSKVFGTFLNEKTLNQEKIELVPMAKTILRQVTFLKE